jgi:hypothetical protein
LEINISIDELILEGFAPSEKYRIGEAVQRELERLFLEQAHAPESISTSARDDVDAGTFTLTTTRSDVIGAQIARSVYDGLRTEA